MWIYVFGSLSRGEVDANSDIDTLCICHPNELASTPNSMQTYTLDELKEIFINGDLFAHHLYHESKLIYSSDGTDVIRNLNSPSPYTNWVDDINSFINIAFYAIEENLLKGQTVFRKGLLYMSLRDIAMIYSNVKMNVSNFSKYSPYQIDISLNTNTEEYEALRLCRISSTRGTYNELIHKELSESCFIHAQEWVNKIYNWSKSNA
ncbi:MAG: nucleotidyltransferase domain-containing protein [Steroidobacteraceae bacterium]